MRSNKISRGSIRLWPLLLCWLWAAMATAEPLAGDKVIYLLDKTGMEIPVGTITFKPQAEGAHYSLHMDHARFKDFFLSMKEMKCLEGPELWCHLPYPYEQPHLVSGDDLRWLEHDLLFMFKSPDEFGANFWNGIYYQMQLKDGQITGQAQAIDLNNLASPPADLNIPPLHENLRDPIERKHRWLPDLVIR
ncbi:hypothetical protein ACFVYJ_06330 [Pontibacter sp. JAM-7]|uniref:hypothetical protein n=1 Tax=Pontibacter sp. JAM-7 TaxID=3366581 RepID=UPI003AF5550B